MHVIVAASQKGGAGKTTLTRSLAVAAQERHGPVALLDTDPQGSLTSWWNRRQADEPALVRTEMADLDAALRRLEAAGISQVYIDTPPSAHPWIAGLLARATLALVPVRPSPDDLDAVGDTLDMIEAIGVNFAFVVMQAKPRTRLAIEAIPVLAKHGKVAPTVIHDRIDFPTAAVRGLTVTETEPDSRSAIEVQELLAYVLTQLRRPASKAAREYVHA
jgi:chromosome partitioning protein